MLTLQYSTGLPKATTLQYKRDDVLEAIACRVTQEMNKTVQLKYKLRACSS